MKPSKKAKAWRKEHAWFGKYPYSTNIALAIHVELVSSGIEADSDAYYEELNKRLQPHAKTILAEQLGILDRWLEHCEPKKGKEE